MARARAEFVAGLLMRALRPALDAKGSVRQPILRTVATYFAVLEDCPDPYRFVVRRTFADRRVDDDPVTSHKTLIAHSLSKLIGAYIRSFGLDSGGVEVWSRGLVGMVEAARNWWLQQQAMGPVAATPDLRHRTAAVLRPGVGGPRVFHREPEACLSTGARSVHRSRRWLCRKVTPPRRLDLC